MSKESRWKSFLSSSHQFQITAFRSAGITLHSGGHINVVAKGEENLTEEPGAENLLLAFSSCLQSANSNPGNGTRLVRVEPKLPLSQHSFRRKPGADGYGRTQEWKKHKIVSDKAPSHQSFGAPRLLKPQKASVEIILEKFPPAGLPSHNSFWAYCNFIWIYKAATKENVTQAIFGTASSISPHEKSMGFFIQHFFNFRSSILQLLQVFGPPIKLGAVFNHLMHQRNIKHERVFQKRLWLGCCFKWSPNFPTSEPGTAVNQAEDLGTLCQLGKPRANWFIHHLASTGPGIEEVIGSNIFLMPKTTISPLLR